MCIIIYFILSTGEGFGSFCDTFSFIDSSKALLKFDKDSELNALYGFKVIMMISIIMGHRLFSILGNPLSNPKRLESVSHENIFEKELPRHYKKQDNYTLANFKC